VTLQDSIASGLISVWSVSAFLQEQPLPAPCTWIKRLSCACGVQGFAQLVELNMELCLLVSIYTGVILIWLLVCLNCKTSSTPNLSCLLFYQGTSTRWTRPWACPGGWRCVAHQDGVQAVWDEGGGRLAWHNYRSLKYSKSKARESPSTWTTFASSIPQAAFIRKQVCGHFCGLYFAAYDMAWLCEGTKHFSPQIFLQRAWWRIQLKTCVMLFYDKMCFASNTWHIFPSLESWEEADHRCIYTTFSGDCIPCLFWGHISTYNYTAFFAVHCWFQIMSLSVLLQLPIATVRFVAVSATIPNIKDIVHWLEAPLSGLRVYGEEMRPCKLRTYVR